MTFFLLLGGFLMDSWVGGKLTEWQEGPGMFTRITAEVPEEPAGWWT